MKDNYNIDEHLRRSLRSYSEQPAGDSFAAVMQKLAAAKRKRRMFYWLFGGSASLALLLSISYSLVRSVTPMDKAVKAVVVQPAATQTPRQGVMEETKKQNVEQRDTPIKDKQTNPVALEIQQNSGHRKPPEESTLPAGTDFPSAGQDAENKQLVVVNNTKSGQPLVDEQSAQEPTALGETDLPEQEMTEQLSIPPVFLEQHSFVLSDSSRHEVFSTALDPLALEYAPLLSTTWKRYHFLLGLHFDPQIMRFAFTENRNRDNLYDSLLGKDFTDRYLDQRKKFNKPFFSYAYGLKVGLAIEKKWEIWLGFGYQRYHYNDVVSPIPFSNTSTLTLTPSVQSLDPASATVIYSYACYSAEVRRTGQLNHWLRMNNGVGLRVTRLSSQRVSVRNNGYYFSDMSFFNSLSEWGVVMEAKTGAIADLGRRFQLRLSPGIFYSPSSLFDKGYLIKQKPYGFQVEGMLIYVLNP